MSIKDIKDIKTVALTSPIIPFKYPNLFEAQQYQGMGDAKYDVTLVLDPNIKEHMEFKKQYEDVLENMLKQFKTVATPMQLDVLKVESYIKEEWNKEKTEKTGNLLIKCACKNTKLINGRFVREDNCRG